MPKFSDQTIAVPEKTWALGKPDQVTCDDCTETEGLAAYPDPRSNDAVIRLCQPCHDWLLQQVPEFSLCDAFVMDKMLRAAWRLVTALEWHRHQMDKLNAGHGDE